MTEEQVFLSAVDLPDATARAAYLDEVCGKGGEFRRRVEALLAAHFKSGAFLDIPAAEQVQTGSKNDLTVAVTGAAVSAENDHESADLNFLSPSTRPDSLGRLGHYEMLQVLGKGGFGIVFRAFDDTLQRVVAVKVMAPMIAATSPARKRFLREARSSAAVRHDNVVQVYEVGEQPLPHLVIEFIPGETLQQKLDRTGPLEVPEVLRIGREIAEGLAAAHASDLIHRDIKPSNILLEGGSHKAKITDFGLARAADDASLSQSGVIAGTPNFMAPEQALGQHIDERADLFSLGSVLYQMVSGRPPFRAPSALAVLKRVAEEPPRPIPQIIPETPDWLCGIIAKLHAKNPDDRFQSARELADLLADCEAKLKVKQEVINTLPAASKPPAPTASGGRKWVAAAALVLLPVIALAVTELAGVTHLLRGRKSTPVVKVDTPKKDDPSAQVDPPVPDENKAPAPEAPSIHDAWLRAVAIVPRDEHAAALAAKMKEQLPGFEDAFLKAIPAVAAGRQEVMVDVWLKEHRPAFAGLEAAWLKAIPSMAADTQMVVVSAWLKECNPGFDGSVTHKIEDGAVTHLEVPSPIVQDLTPLRALTKLRTLTCRSTVGYDHRATHDADVLHSLKSLEKINDRLVAQFWKEIAARNAEFQEWLELVPALTAGQQVQAVSAKLKERNPGFDGTMGHKIEDGVVTEVQVRGHVMDISPLRVFNGLRVLDCSGNGQLSDLTPLKGMNLAGLTILNLHTTHVTDAGLAYFKDCKNLSYLQLSETLIGDAGLAWFKDCKNLTVLELAKTQVTDTGLANFKDCKNLTNLSLWVTQVSDAGLAHFKDCKNLIVLDLNNTQVGDAGLVSFQDCKNLTLLDLRNTQVGDAGLAHFQDCKILTAINLSGTQVTDVGLAHLVGLDGLTHLYLSGTKVTDAGLASFKGCKNLTHLAVDDCHQVTDAGLACFKDCKNLALLDLRNTQVSDVGVADFKDCKNLTALNLTGTQVTDAGLANFSGLDRLTHLYLTGTQVTDAGLAHFKDCKNLTHLSVDACPQITDAGLAHFKNCTMLTQLGLHNTQVSDVGLAYFKDCKNLTVLELRGTRVADLSPLKGMPLQVLWCDFHPERDAQVLRAIPTLKTINGEMAEDFWKSLEKK